MLALLAALAFGQDALTMSAVRQAQVGLGAPSVTFHTNVSGRVTARLSCAGRSFSLDEQVAPGQQHTITLEGLPEGTHTCSGSLDLSAADGTTGQMPLSVQVAMYPPLKLEVSREELDLDAHTLVVTADRPIGKVAVDVFGVGGAKVGHGQIGGAPNTRVELQWAQDGGEAIKLEVTAWDAYELPGRLELSPWSYDIPHEDVVFATNQHAIAPAEEPKLEKAWKELQDVLAKYGEVVEVKLFVAGYTDTVGAPGSNQALSDRRARAIAGWFRQRGFDGPIAYQGFGESALAVPTADEVDEARNRRALYILAAETPPVSSELPRRSWKTL